MPCVQIAFDELKSPASGKVTRKAFEGWEEVRLMLEDGLLDRAALRSVLDEVAPGNAELDLQAFTEAVGLMDDVANEAGESDEDDDETMRVIFDGLKDQATGRVTREKFLAWEEVREIVKDGFVSLADIGRSVPATMDFEAFLAAIDAIDSAAGDSSEEEEVEEEESWEGGARDEESLQDLFDELRSAKSKKVSVQLLLKWSELDALFKTGVLDDELVRVLVAEAGSTINGELTFPQFKGASVFS